MPQLLTLPLAVPLSSAGLLLPGCKLYSYVTGTSTPQPVYQDIGLATPHANPVEANGAGVFPPIYLHPGLPNYRLSLTSATDVTQPGYPLDNVPSGSEGVVAKAFKSLSTDRLSVTAIADDPDLLLALQANATYRIDVFILMVGVVTGTQGFKFAIGYTGSVNIMASAMGIQAANGVATVRVPFTPTDTNSLGTLATAGNDGLVYSFLLKTTTAGNLSFRWAQASSSANATRVVTGSHMMATRLG